MAVSKTAILKEAIARSTTDKYNKIELKGDFQEQDAFINDPSRYIAVQCSRRSGKTTGLALKFFKAMEKHPKSQCIYLSLTQDSARSILWPVLQEIDDKYKIGCTFTESKLEVKHPNGAKLKLMGADLKNFIKRLRGRKYPAVGIDEIQDMGPHVQSLIDDVLTPSIADYPDSWLAITGTPGPVPQGYFFEVTQSKKYGYSLHNWTVLQNPHMPNANDFLADLKKKREWTDDNPTYRREWLNQWVLDAKSLWIQYDEKKNHFDHLPQDKDYKWNYILGVDIGFNDADAIAVLAWSEITPVTYIVDEVIKSKQGISALIEMIDKTQKKYNAYKIVMDEGGLGKKVAEDLRQRFGCPIEPADKAHKQSNVEFLNDGLRRSEVKAPKTSRFARDSYLVQIDWEKSAPNRVVLKKTPHSDIIDAVLYAFRESYSYTHRPSAPKAPVWGSKEWADQQQGSMFEAELAGLQAEVAYRKEYLGE